MSLGKMRGRGRGRGSGMSRRSKLVSLGHEGAEGRAAPSLESTLKTISHAGRAGPTAAHKSGGDGLPQASAASAAVGAPSHSSGFAGGAYNATGRGGKGRGKGKGKGPGKGKGRGKGKGKGTGKGKGKGKGKGTGNADALWATALKEIRDITLPWYCDTNGRGQGSLPCLAFTATRARQAATTHNLYSSMVAAEKFKEKFKAKGAALGREIAEVAQQLQSNPRKAGPLMRKGAELQSQLDALPAQKAQAEQASQYASPRKKLLAKAEEAEGAVSEALDSAGVKNDEKNKFTMRAFWVMFDTFCAAPVDSTKGADKRHCSAALVTRRRELSAKKGIALNNAAAAK